MWKSCGFSNRNIYIWSDKPYVMRKTLYSALFFAVLSVQALAQSAILSSGGDVAIAGYGSMSFSNAQLSVEQTSVSAGRVSYGVQIPVEIYGARLAGLLRYANTARTPMTNTRINLLANGQLVDTARTDVNGAYLFSGIPQGIYQMTATTNKPWGGLGAVNSSDALIMKRHFNVMTTLTGINFRAGDVNGTNIINGTDALLVHRRYVGSDNSFPVGDWAYDLPSSKQINSGQELQESNLALVYGDVNGTYTPDINLRQQWINLDPKGTLQASNGIIEWPVYAQGSYDLGAVSLDLEIPEGLSVQGIRMGGEASNADLIYKQEGRQLRMGWYSLEPFQVRDGEPLLFLQLSGNGEGELSMGKYSELADAWAVSYGDFMLSAPRLQNRNNPSSWQAVVYPNPSNANTSLSVRLPSSGDLSVTITDLSGRVVNQATYFFASNGNQEINLESASWAEGQYHVALNFVSATQEFSTRLKFNKIK
jgi:hypothetical protein